MFEAEVTDRGIPRLTAPKEGSALVYTPITVTVTAVYGGDLKPGASVVLRSIGGTTPDGVKINSDEWPAAVWKAGTHVVAFTEPGVDAGDGVVAFTPNFLFVQDQGVAEDPFGKEMSMEVKAMRQGLEARFQQ